MFIVKRIYSFLDIQRFSAQEKNKLYKAKAADDKHASLDRFMHFMYFVQIMGYLGLILT